MQNKLIFLFLMVLVIVPLSNGQQLPPPDNPPTPEPRPPIIPMHTPVGEFLEGTPIDITIKIQGSRPEDIVNLSFREKGTHEFHVLPMGYNPETKMHEATIDERYQSRETIEYYVAIFPVGAQAIRVPPEQDRFFEVKISRNSARVIRLILIALLVASPAIIAFIVGRMYRLHVKQATLYQQKLNARRRSLAKQREKHYQDYWRKMSGAHKAGQKPSVAPMETGSPPLVPPKTDLQKPPIETDEVQFTLDEMVEADELKRELDGILSNRKEGPKQPVQAPPPPQKPSNPPPASSRKPPTSNKTKPNPVAQTESTKPQAKASEDNSFDPERTDTKKLGKNERDKLLDILGLDI